jgi:hypothetical protein
LNQDGLRGQLSAHSRQPAQLPRLIRSWCRLVSVGSEIAVKIARVI